MKCNLLAKESDLIIYSDAGKDKGSQANVDSVRDYLLNVDGFKSISIIYRKENYGLAKNISEGVTEVINKYGKAIILEDDLVTSPYFLKFMNDALAKYQKNKNVWHISGWNYPISTDNLPETFFLANNELLGVGYMER
ncbi:glycosyltransferase [Photobacterium angustum]|uniref:glycosyltransferase n=1 Tax=Photobacterium angustum TaxID=661 RepID=UPI000AFEE8FD|nr:glycosyltransferase [Photobacterium angustum]